MIELTNSAGYILSFDGRVIENFYNAGNMRMHISHVQNVEVEENKKGQLWIKIKGHNQVCNLMDIDPENRGLVEEFVSQINSARS